LVRVRARNVDHGKLRIDLSGASGNSPAVYWHMVATLATWGMTLVIQRAEHRDTQAIHAKLDELLKANGAANNTLMNIDDKEAEEVEHERDEVRRSAWTRPQRRS